MASSRSSSRPSKSPSASRGAPAPPASPRRRGSATDEPALPFIPRERPPGSHQVLVVMRDPAAAVAIGNICRSLGYESRFAASLADVGPAVAQGRFCLVVVDPELAAEPGAAPLLLTGRTAVARLRELAPRRLESDAHALQILILSDHASDGAFVFSMMHHGADDFLFPQAGGAPRSREQHADAVAHALQECLRRSGREDHAACAGLLGMPPGATVRIEIDGMTSGRLNGILVGEQRLMMQNAPFIVLLPLLAKHRRNPATLTPPEALGVTRSHWYPSEINRMFRPFVGEDFDVILTKYNDGLRIHSGVDVVGIDFVALSQHTHPRVKQIALVYGGVAG